MADNLTITSTITNRVAQEEPAPNEEVEIVVTALQEAGLDVHNPGDWTAATDLAALSTMNTNDIISSLNSANPPKKITVPGDKASIVEIRPPIKQVPNGIPLFVEMVDSDQNTCYFYADDGTVIQALKLNPNPDSIIINSSKIINRYNTMTRWVEEHWGDEIDTVTLSGSTYSLMAFQPEAGLTVVNRNTTAPYLYMKELIRFYRTNGCLYQGDDYEGGDVSLGPVSRFLQDNPSFIKHPMRGMIKERVMVRITFDYAIFIGYFENFDLIEDSNSPYRFTYNATFKSEHTKYIIGS